MGALLKYIDKVRGVENKWRVRSRTEPHLFHIVEVLNNGKMDCDCISGSYGRECRHQKLVKSKLKK